MREQSPAGSSRIPWGQLPAAIHDRVEEVLGSPVIAVAPQTGGFSSGSADRVSARSGDRAFVKAVSRSRNADTFALHLRELALMKVLPLSVRAPRLRGWFADDEWVALVIDDIDGHHPTANAGMKALSAVLSAFESLPVARTAAFPALANAADELAGEFAGWTRLSADDAKNGLTQWVTRNFAALELLASGASEAVSGDHLVHLDCRSDNVIVDTAGTAWLIDWPWAGLGARWLDGLTFLLDLRLKGDRTDLDRVLAEHPLFAASSPDEIDCVLAGLAGAFFDKARQPAPAHMQGLRAFQYSEALAAASWLQDRRPDLR